MLLLAIESSCDETSVALLKDGKLIDFVTDSQIDTFEEYGGVVPEISSRLHVENFPKVFKALQKKTKIAWEDVEAVCYTASPGLAGPLMVGENVARTFAAYYGIPCQPVNHIYGHLMSISLSQKVEYPALALVVSGGHTQLIMMQSETRYAVVGETEDDAVGECYDKVARVLGLDYPGGPKVDKAAQSGRNTIKFTLPMDDESYNFSFSGLKSQCINMATKLKRRGELDINDFAASFQYTAIEILIKKTKDAWLNGDFKSLICVGGVSANSELRKRIKEITYNAYTPELKFTGDNAAMIGMAGFHIYEMDEEQHKKEQVEEAKKAEKMRKEKPKKDAERKKKGIV